MDIKINVPTQENTVGNSFPVNIARRGERWKQSQLGQHANEKGIYIIHHNSTIKYVGSTVGTTMTFGVRLRREFQYSAAQGKHIYPKLSQLFTPPDIKVSLINLEKVNSLIESIDFGIDAMGKVLILEQTLIAVYKPEFQTGGR